MNIIPKLNGPVTKGSGTCKVSLPLTYGGECPFAAQFNLQKSETPVLTFAVDSTIADEGYTLTVEDGKITVTSGSESGAFYAVQTVMQMLEDGDELPCGTYSDAPKYHHRGFMLDVSRHYFPLSEVKRVIDQCARLKLNVFHWHLSDDQGYRIESRKFPRLNEVSSWRMEGDEKVGGYYTHEEIKDLVAYAAERYIQVIPEIDLPGHTTAIVAAYPELSCCGKPVDVKVGAGIYPQILCGGNEKVYEFLAELFDEVCPLFPSPYFHIGGDEAPKSEWEKCPKCQEEIKKHGLSGEEELQARFTEKLAEMLAKHGKSITGWNEIFASGKMAPSAIGQYWTPQGGEYCENEVKNGRKFIFSNVSSFYFDYDPAIITLRATYGYEPCIVEGEAIPAEQVLGLEAPLWTEYVATPERLQTMILPRLAALAENAWTVEKDFECFKKRVAAHEKYWAENGLAFTPIDAADVCDEGVEERAADAILEQLMRWRGAGASGVDAAAQEAAFPLVPMSQAVLGMMSNTYTPEQKQKIAELINEKIK